MSICLCVVKLGMYENFFTVYMKGPWQNHHEHHNRE